MARLCVAALTGLVLMGGAAAQSGNVTRQSSSLALAAGSLPGGAGALLAEMAARAGVIFTGQVVGVTRSDALGFVDVRFHIEQPVRGCPATGFYTMREWAGLWTAHPNRFREGEHLLMLLTARSASGMSSPVGGMDGAIPLVATAAEPVAMGALVPADHAASASYAVDLRWVQARVERSTKAVKAADVQAHAAASNAWPGPITPLLTNPERAATAGLDTVLALLGGSAGSADAR